MAVYSNQLFRATSTTGFATLGANTFTATQTIIPAANTNALAVTGYSLTGTNAQSLLDLAGTWNTSGAPTALKLNIANTASSANSLLVDMQVGGASLAAVRSDGYMYASRYFVGSSFSGTGFIYSDGGGLYLAGSGGAVAEVRNLSGFLVSSAYSIGFGGLGSAPTTALFADAAGILAQRNGVNAQTFRVYNTFTDASNYERGVFDWGTTANTLTIGPQAAGTGTLRGVSAIGTWSFANAVMHASSIALTNGAGAQIATMTNGPTAGNPTKWVPINDNGTTRYIPAW